MVVDKMKYSGRKFTCDDKNNISSKICYSINKIQISQENKGARI